MAQPSKSLKSCVCPQLPRYPFSFPRFVVLIFNLKDGCNHVGSFVSFCFRFRDDVRADSIEIGLDVGISLLVEYHPLPRYLLTRGKTCYFVSYNYRCSLCPVGCLESFHIPKMGESTSEYPNSNGTNSSPGRYLTVLIQFN